MIVLGDSRSDGSWDTAIDPRTGEAAEWPSRRHSLGSNMMFVDGHAEYGRQAEWVAKTTEARKRWNADNLPWLNRSPGRAR
jgi:prepilin-type processing-associated H-X9-DG protein